MYKILRKLIEQYKKRQNRFNHTLSERNNINPTNLYKNTVI